jgi:hypothetical protein
MLANKLLSVMQVIHEDFIVTGIPVFLSAFNMKVHFPVHRRMAGSHLETGRAFTFTSGIKTYEMYKFRTVKNATSTANGYNTWLT